MKTFEEFITWEQSSRDTIDFKKAYVDVTSDVVTGLLLSQIVFWHLPNKQGQTKLRVFKKGELWLAKTRTDWWEETRITPKQFDRAIKKLKEKKILKTKVFKFNGNPTIHICLNKELFVSLINEATTNPPSNPFLPKGEKRNHPNGNKEIDEKVISLTEITTESTSEITKKDNNGAFSEENRSAYYLKSHNHLKPVLEYFYNAYRTIFNVHHPKIKIWQLEEICETLNSYGFDLQEWIDVIDAYFNQPFKEGCDYRLNHFVSGDIIYLRGLELDLLDPDYDRHIGR